MKILIASLAILIPALTNAGEMCYNLHRLDRRAEIAEVEDRDKESDFEHVLRAGVACDTSSTPLGVFAIQEVAMATMCDKYQVAKCWKTGDLNPGCMGDCSRCGVGAFDNVPTVGDMQELYEKFAATSIRVRPVTVRGNLAAFRRFANLTGLNGDTKVAAIGEDDYTKFVVAARDAKMSEATIESTLEHIRSIFSRAAIRFYSTVGKTVEPLPPFDFKAVTAKWISLTREQRQKIRVYQMDLFDLADPRKYLAVTAAWERGMRKSDVLRQHWSVNFQQRDGVVWWDYVANKTGKLSQWPVDPDTWLCLRKAKAKLEKLSVHKLGKHPDSYLRVREHAKNEVVSSEIWDACGADLRDLMGWTGAKAMHNLRKDATDQVYQHIGIDEACEFSGDTDKIIRAHYAGKKRIDPRTISIVKM